MTEHLTGDLYLITQKEKIHGKNSALEPDFVTGPVLASVTRFPHTLGNVVHVQTFPIPSGFPVTKEELLGHPTAILAIRTGGGKNLLEVDASLFPEPPVQPPLFNK